MTLRSRLRRLLRGQPFRKKLTTVIMLVAATALLMSSLGLVAVQFLHERETAADRNLQVATVLADNLAAAVVFNDHETADRITQSIKHSNDVEFIEVRSLTGGVVSLYRREIGTLADNALGPLLLGESPAEGQVQSLGNQGYLAVPIKADGEKVGTLILSFTYRGFWGIVVDTLPVALAIFAACLLFARLLAGWLRSSLFKPLDLLTRSMDNVGKSGNLEARIAVSADSDLAVISRSFNGMLEHLELNKAELSVAMEALAHARDQAHAAYVAKSDFLANMSHELRTPLNAIIGYAEVLREDLSMAGLTQSAEDVEWIHGSSMQLLELINGVLDLSKIEAGQMQVDVTQFPLGPVFDELEALLKPLAAKNGNLLSVVVDDPELTMHSDPVKLRQALVNLGGNACKFTREGAVDIRARLRERMLEVEVRDTGIGIDEDQQKHLFKPFAQADTSITRTFGGTGLGLSLVHRFATILGGSVAVSSVLGKGSTFLLRVPIDARSAPDRASDDPVLPFVKSATPNLPAESGQLLADDPETSQASPLALVIEDDPGARALLCRLLDQYGYRHVEATDGAAGLRMALQVRPQIVLLDIALPSIDGWHVLREIAQSPQLAAIPVVIVSADDRAPLSAALGAVAHIMKPVRRMQLAEVLNLHTVQPHRP